VIQIIRFKVGIGIDACIWPATVQISLQLRVGPAMFKRLVGLCIDKFIVVRGRSA